MLLSFRSLKFEVHSIEPDQLKNMKSHVIITCKVHARYEREPVYDQLQVIFCYILKPHEGI